MSDMIFMSDRAVLLRPQSGAEIRDAAADLEQRYGTEFLAMVVGWWEAKHFGHQFYTKPLFAIDGYHDDWMLTRNRGHVVRPLAGRRCFWAVEFVPAGGRTIISLSLDELGADSPLGFAPTRAFPGSDIIGIQTLADLREFEAHAKGEPPDAVLRRLQHSATGAILSAPEHSLDIDRVWYWLARTYGLKAERDIRAYACGWWQLRIEGPHGANVLPFCTPIPIVGFHHPPGAPKVRWVYVEDRASFLEIRPVPASAGHPASWVDYRFDSEMPPIDLTDLMRAFPVRQIKGVRRDETFPAREIAEVLAQHADMPAPARRFLALPIPVLASLLYCKNREDCLEAACDAAAWMAQFVADGDDDHAWMPLIRPYLAAVYGL